MAAKDIVILSKKKLKNSFLSELNSVCSLTITEHENITDFSNTSLNFYTIQSYKGLEANIVFLIDVDGFEDQHNRYANISKERQYATTNNQTRHNKNAC